VGSTPDMSFRNIYANRYDATSNPGQGFWKLMLVWKGSVLKLIWIDLVKYYFYSAMYVLHFSKLVKNC
jgi:predicted membrane chloride channel (bestrophin family)